MLDLAALKTMISFSADREEADSIITEFTPWRDVNTKLAFLSGMFNAAVVSRQSGTEEDDYRAILSAIVNSGW